MTDQPKSRYNITALHRGLKLLTLVADARRTLAAGEIAQLSGLHTSTVHRFLVNLESAGFLTREESTGRYQLGSACVTLGRAALDRLDVHHISLPYLQELNRLTRETIHLTVRHNLSAVYVEKLESLEPLRTFSQVGAAVPLHCTGVGKVFLAYAEDRPALLSRLVLTRATSNSITSLQQLESELNRVRRQGYATDDEEYETHIRCIAGPLWDHAGHVRAAFSITGPAARMTKTRLRQLAPLVIKLSKDVSERMGYDPLAAPPKPRRVRRPSAGAKQIARESEHGEGAEDRKRRQV
jgi:DNA-binding IclR family transcriptional regulator